MIDMSYVEHDLLEMKAATLYKYGKKLEIAEKMFHSKTALKERLEKMLHRLRTEKVIRSGWFRKKRQAKLTERVQAKLENTERTLKKLEELKNKYLDEFKFQREAVGMMDHTFIDEYYHEGQHKAEDEE